MKQNSIYEVIMCLKLVNATSSLKREDIDVIVFAG